MSRKEPMVGLVSKKTNLDHTIPLSQWEAMKLDGRSRYYHLTTPIESKKPVDLQTKNYESLLRKAGKVYKEEKYVVALNLYKQASKIKASPFIDGRLAELAQIIENQQEN